jgi:hypothetical protein
MGYAYYDMDAQDPMIVIAGTPPESIDREELQCTSIAHEYMHHIQRMQGRYDKQTNEQNEREAEEFAETIWDKYSGNVSRERKEVSQ